MAQLFTTRPRRLFIRDRPGGLGGAEARADLHLRLLPDLDPDRQSRLHQPAGRHAADRRHLPGRGFHADRGAAADAGREKARSRGAAGPSRCTLGCG